MQDKRVVSSRDVTDEQLEKLRREVEFLELRVRRQVALDQMREDRAERIENRQKRLSGRKG